MGLEIEFADLQTIDAVDLVYGFQGMSAVGWQDRYGAYSKPSYDWSIWNIASDGSIENSDGSRCMWTFMEDGVLKHANASRKSPDRMKWKGFELISPVSTRPESLIEDMKALVVDLVKSGARAQLGMHTALHVHIDISDWEWQKVARLVPLIYKVQDLVKPLESGWYGRMVFTGAEVAKLNPLAMLKNEWWAQYRTIDGKLYPRLHRKIRRAIDVSPYFDDVRLYQTIEFRCFRSSEDPEVLEGQVRLAMEIFEQFKAGVLDIDKIKAQVAAILARIEGEEK